jgi:hypothetical protein
LFRDRAAQAISYSKARAGADRQVVKVQTVTHLEHFGFYLPDELTFHLDDQEASCLAERPKRG